MRLPVGRTSRLTATAAVAALALGACGRLNRVATINQVTTTSGSSVAAELDRQLAQHGLSSAHATCTKAVVQQVDARNACTLTGAGKEKVVRFSFSSNDGHIQVASVEETQ